MDKIVIHGGRSLNGEVLVSGSKNAALPLLFSSLLTPEPCTFRGIPHLADIRTTLKLLTVLGASVELDAWAAGPGDLTISAKTVDQLEAPYDLVKTMRASFLVLGPLLSRFGRARVSAPGGCAIGSRPVNLHLKGFAEMGAEISQSHGYIEAKAERLRGATIHLDLPSVGATENLMMAATLAQGTTVIRNAAREPEIEDLGAALNKMGGTVRGAGTDTIEIDGADALHGITYRVIPDRIEAASFVIAGALTNGRVIVKGARPEHLTAFLSKLAEAGIGIETGDGYIKTMGACRVGSVDVTTLPYPGFPTDLQAQVMVLMSIANGVSVISETIFENRFMHALELNRMGADIRLDGHRAIVRGVVGLSGAPVMATDLRASVSLVLAGLVASGRTEVARVYHLDRGYEQIEQKLSQLGADIARVKE